ncbi:hypothetical protein IVB12_15765 [Bradyrhizobium sp. 179]|uniref:hypothetical protein n=1 Tax=Bradyrhizobium sp. 179 TaxID=2782648 RepID=UPI001FFBE5F4|nr:hypothetical protein [Bradyrhizobium sp. 179]MCK1543373.1 hypothetical protein [Bradyrhizobium sp. 179]
MALYLVEAERISVRQIEVEADSADEAREKAQSMSEYQIESSFPEDSYYWQFDWHPVRVNEDLQPIPDPRPAPMSVRLGGDEIMHNLLLDDSTHLPVEACQ